MVQCCRFVVVVFFKYHVELLPVDTVVLFQAIKVVKPNFTPDSKPGRDDYSSPLLTALNSSSEVYFLNVFTTTILQPFVRYYPGELLPEETFTYSHLS